MENERSSEAPERETDQEIKDRQNAELESERTERAERLGHDIRREETRVEETRMEESAPSESQQDDSQSEQDESQSESQ
jgi:hypothetical protein